MADVFISYARPDRALADQLADLLKRAGIDFFYDQALTPGDAWDRRIEAELALAKAVVVIWSETSVDRTWVRNEARYGLKRDMLFPLSVDGVEPPLEFSHCQSEVLPRDALQAEAPGMRRFLEVLAVQLGVTLPQPAKAEAPKPKPPEPAAKKPTKAPTKSAAPKPAKSPKEAPPPVVTGTLSDTADICVIGVGGAGANMLEASIPTLSSGVNFVVANTDVEALKQSSAPVKIQLGQGVAKGKGAGGRPDVGAVAAEQVIEELVDLICKHKVCIILAGLGGGTGTGAAPIIAQIAYELNCACFGIFTVPFSFEGAGRMKKANDSLGYYQRLGVGGVVVRNQRLFRMASESTTFSEAFTFADETIGKVLAAVVDSALQQSALSKGQITLPAVAELEEVSDAEHGLLVDLKTYREGEQG